MRIHLVSEHASPLALLGGVDAGGQNVHVAALARALATLGHHVVVHTRRDDPALPRRVRYSDRVEVDHVDAGPPEPMPKDDLLPHMDAFADDLAAAWTRQRPDVVHAHFWMSGLAAHTAADALGIPVALTYHALGAEKRRQQGSSDTSPDARIDIERWLAANVDMVIATTASERRFHLGQGASADRVTVIPCGVDLELFHPGGAHGADRADVTRSRTRSVAAMVASTSRSGRSRRRVVCVSRLVPRKGLEDAVVAVAGLPDVELVIAGGPPAAMLCEDPHAARLAALASDLGASDRITLLGSIEHELIPPLLRSADVVCCTPWYEPFGLVAVEAMACGTPVIATAVGGLAETVVDGRTGALVPPRCPASLRSAIERITGDPAHRDVLGAASVERAQHYGWRSVAARTRDVLASLVRRGPRSASEPTLDTYRTPMGIGGGS